CGVRCSEHSGTPVVTGVPYANTVQRISPSDWQALSDIERRVLQKERRKSDAYKTALCREFKGAGKCAYGGDCRFAHGEHELRLPAQFKAHPKYKTQLCKNFTKDGRCPYGARCRFIHRRPDEVILANVAHVCVVQHYASSCRFLTYWNCFAY
ncbi:unnamed protein product, partial [Toxocara canis]|uniref:C3H1-type domain-containing protein n=1 Tax=Toxocara canis TaxID=6265 RepID=A0A183TY45_TOXCA